MGTKVETTSYAAMMRRMIRAHGRRVADGDPADVAEMIRLRDDLDAAIRDAIAGQREAHGFSWGDLARDLGMTRQGVQQRWGRRTAPVAGDRQPYPGAKPLPL